MARIQVTERRNDSSIVNLTDNDFNKRRNGEFGDVLKYKVNNTDGADFFEPLGKRDNQIVDMVHDAQWCPNPKESKEDLPFIKLREFQPRFSSGVQDLFSTANSIADALEQNDLGSIIKTSGIVSNPIANSLLARRTKFVYKIPLTVNTQHSFLTQFGSGEGSTSSAGGILDYVKNNLVETGGSGDLGKLLSFGILDNIAPIGNMLYPAVSNIQQSEKYYNASVPAGFDIEIPLINTNGDYEQMQYHKDLINLLSNNMGTANNRNKFVGTSPCIYELEITDNKNNGVLWMPACKIDFSYQPSGSFKTISDGVFSQVDTIKFTVEPFFPHMRVVDYNYIHNGLKLHAINYDIKALCNTMQRYLDLYESGKQAIRNFNQRDHEGS